jgi:hypothetical protein
VHVSQPVARIPGKRKRAAACGPLVKRSILKSRVSTELGPLAYTVAGARSWLICAQTCPPSRMFGVYCRPSTHTVAKPLKLGTVLYRISMWSMERSHPLKSSGRVRSFERII